MIELLVVIAIIAILLALLTPAMDRAIETSVRATCSARQHSIAQILAGYASANHGRYPGGDMDCAGESVFQINTPFVDAIVSYSGNNKSVRRVTNDPVSGDYFWGIVPQILIDPSYKDFGYKNVCGYLMGYQVLSGKTILTNLHRPPAAPAGTIPWESPLGLTKSGSGTLVTCINSWVEGSGSRLWVAHGKEGGPLGEEASTYTVFRAPADIRGTNLDSPDDDLSAGGNIANVDGSVAWKNLQDMDLHPHNSSGWAPTGGLTLW